jgi:putative endonuclease
MAKIFTSKKQRIGEISENIAKKFLMKHGFSIVDSNYTKKWGEIDIIAEKMNKLYFIEVKSITSSSYRPEENMHSHKVKRLMRTIETYLMSNRIPNEKEWQVDLIVVFLNIKNKKAKIKVLKNIIL